jgi:hypothetical protein
MMKRICLILGLLLWPCAALAQQPVVSQCATGNPTNPWTACPYPFVPLGPSQNALGTTPAVGLTIPINANYALVCAETATVRWTWDGTTTPNSTVGSPIASGSCVPFSGPKILANLKFFSSSGTIDVEYAQ